MTYWITGNVRDVIVAVWEPVLDLELFGRPVRLPGRREKVSGWVELAEALPEETCERLGLERSVSMDESV